jgi:thioredoxin reductase
MSEPDTFHFNGEPLPMLRGESLAAALTAAGIRDLRTTRTGQSRGVFCGMGVCQDCLVQIDGQPNQRACMVSVEAGMQVWPQSPVGALPPAAAPLEPITLADLRIERPEVLVIGAGPGGLSAAIAARGAGAEVVLLDERTRPGGQYYKQLAVQASVPDAQHRAGARLIVRAVAAGVDMRCGTFVWGAFGPREFVASTAGGTVRFEPRCAIIATGAYERAWPVPGWTLPGVMTTGAAQTLWRSARRLPGRRVVIAGNGPLNLQLAAELLSGGAEVLAVIEVAPLPGLARFGDLLTMVARAPGLVRDGLRYLATLRSRGVAILHDSAVARISAQDDALRVELAGAASDQCFTTDAVCLGYGFEPANELLRALGCRHDFDPVRRQLITRRDAFGRTDVPGILGLGDCTGLGGAQAALAEGTLAGLAAASDVGHALGPRGPATQRRSARQLARHRRFQGALWRLFAAAPFDPALSTPDTLLCRCEEVSFAQVQAALAEGYDSIGAVKRRTRLGMGRCQGRYCGPVLDAWLATRGGRPRDEFSGFAPRVPIRPLSITDLVRHGQ